MEGLRELGSVERCRDIIACSTIAFSDILTTYLLLWSGRGTELNPILNGVLSHFGLSALIPWLLLEVLAIYSVFRLLRWLRSRFGVGLRVEYLFLTLILYAPVNNILILVQG
jgi:hypothetical protein